MGSKSQKGQSKPNAQIERSGDQTVLEISKDDSSLSSFRNMSNALFSSQQSQNNLLKREEEGLANYKVGGYHPVQIGEVYNNRYEIVSKVGWGHFSTVWLVKDLFSQTDHGIPVQYAMKVQRSAPAYSDAAADELLLLGKVATSLQNDYVVLLFDHFKVMGPHGVHCCMVFELLGENLLTLLKYFAKLPVQNNERNTRFGKGLPVGLVKRIIYDVLVGLEFLHSSCNIIHTDLKPENILLVHPVDTVIQHFDSIQGPIVKIADLGNACWKHRHFTDYITTRQYRSPEAIIEHPYNQKVDIWSVACIVFELLTGDYLFDAKVDKNNLFTRDEDHLALMMELLNMETIPGPLLSRGKLNMKYFRRDGTLRNIKELLFWSIEELLQEKFGMDTSHAYEIAAFMRPMLEMDPRIRCSAAQALRLKWIQDVAVSQGSRFAVYNNNDAMEGNMNNSNSFFVNQNQF